MKGFIGVTMMLDEMDDVEFARGFSRPLLAAVSCDLLSLLALTED